MKSIVLSEINDRVRGSIYQGGEIYDEIGVIITYVENGLTLRHHMAMTVYVDELGDYLDFTKTRYKSLGVIRL